MAADARPSHKAPPPVPPDSEADANTLRNCVAAEARPPPKAPPPFKAPPPVPPDADAGANTLLRGFDDLRGSADQRGMRLRDSDARGPDDHAVAAWSSFVTAGEERLVPVDQLQP